MNAPPVHTPKFRTKVTNLGLLTTAPAVAGGRVVHGLQGGGPGMIDDDGIPWFVARTWCGRDARGALYVPTGRPVTCRSCLRAVEAFQRRRGL